MQKNEIIYDFDPNNLPPEYLQAIGLVTAASAQTESTLELFIGALLGVDTIKAIAIATHMNNPLRENIIRTLAGINAPSIEELDKIDDLMDAVKEAFDKRNMIVHNALATNPETGEVFRYCQKARGNLSAKLTPIKLQEIQQDALSIYKAGMDIMRFMVSRDITPPDGIPPKHSNVSRKKKARQDRRK